MRRLSVPLLLLMAAWWSVLPPAFTRAQEEPPSVTEPPAEASTPAPAFHPDEHLPPDLLPEDHDDAVLMLDERRSAVRAAPESADDRLKLAQALYRIGDLDAALDECRAAIALKPDSAAAHVQLGVILTAKQDWRAASAALKEAIRLDPDLAHAHYSLGGVQYSLGNPKAAMQSYRRALELQPHFPDARYRLALLLTLTNQHRESAQLMEEAALGGVPQAQYFLGNAYRNGQGVEKSLPLAIRWWVTAMGFGHQRAAESLSQLRRRALSPDQPERRRNELLAAFQQYRDDLWKDYPDRIRNGADESLGAVLLKDSPAVNGMTALFAEAYALSEPAHAELARMYEQGLDSRLAPFDRRILHCLETTAADGFMPAKKTLARVYGRGLGVTQDVRKAQTLLKGLPQSEAKALLDEMSAP